MEIKEKNDTGSKKQNRHFMYFILESDKQSNPMSSEKADSILEKILSFFFTNRNNMRRVNNGKN